MNDTPHTDFERAFSPHASFTQPDGVVMLSSVVDAGQLVLPSGRVVACDPGDFDLPSRCLPLARSVAPGSYPVRLAVVAYPHHSGVTVERVACAMLWLSDAAPVRWEMALWPEQRAADLEPGHFFGYGVDTGLGCFVDATAVERMDGDAGEQLYFERLLPALERDDRTLHGVALPLDGEPAATLVAFSTGYGDGVYPSYWGFDAAGAACRLATDFQMLIDRAGGEADV